MTIEITIGYTKTAISDIVSGAFDYIGYWADSAELTSVYQVAALTDLDTEITYGIYADSIEKAAVRIASGEIGVDSNIRENIALSLFAYELADLDAECYDCIIQVACFGDVVYG
jgi:hypothetical protein